MCGSPLRTLECRRDERFGVRDPALSSVSGECVVEQKIFQPEAVCQAIVTATARGRYRRLYSAP
jgi:hypothetical protein